MEIDRLVGQAPRAERLAQQLAAMQGPCVGCSGCRGLCSALIEAVSLPDVILRRDRTT